MADPFSNGLGEGKHVLASDLEEVLAWVHHEVSEGTFVLTNKQEVHICHDKVEEALV